MPEIRSSCNPEMLNLFLKQVLQPDEEELFHSHLDRCESCQKKLEQNAADPDWWRDASDFLIADEIDLEIQATLDGEAIETDDGAIPRGSIAGVMDQLLPTDYPEMIGRFGGYEIVGVIGCGGMGVVLKGFESALNRFVAIKVLAPHLATSGAARNRFSREGQSAASVVHPNVVSIHRVSQANGLPFLVMPYIGGESLQKRSDRDGALPVSAVVRIGLQVCRGLAAAHAQGLVHRDVKPANILLEKDVDRIILTDFGLARAADDASMTKSGVLAGTPQYMSPEQARGERLDQRSDLFSLGSVLYTLCTGRPPFRAETSYGILRKITDTQPRPIREINPDIPSWMATLIASLQSKNPDDRINSAEEAANLLEQCLAHLQQPDLQPLPAELNAWNKRRWPKWVTSSLATGIMICVVVGSLWFNHEPNEITANHSETETVAPSVTSKNEPLVSAYAPAETDDSPPVRTAEPVEIAVQAPLTDQEISELEDLFDDVQSLQDDLKLMESNLQLLDPPQFNPAFEPELRTN
ncbi:serine/threonine-protein kinase [Thalassoglobus polymorphus]|uniref:non-specific serine/threonine protein kinase n=1 Tax=Thalassoglobus polymorphus TaxID=2527994 RepID=A0A517QMC9_9PLAN|nr:serine/threonine-protein kinase [Thalassoglobus polymorphus]QDT32799.1 Serine/threonine-protein kinase PknB [Thalassoglobus polymorphus]